MEFWGDQARDWSEFLVLLVIRYGFLVLISEFGDHPLVLRTACERKPPSGWDSLDFWKARTVSVLIPNSKFCYTSTLANNQSPVTHNESQT